MNDKPWVAVIDDDVSLRAALARILGCHGIRVNTFGSADEYLKRTVDGEPRCILLDLQLDGGLSAFDLREQLISVGTAPPIIFMSGQAEVGFASGSQHDAIDYLRKPFAPASLIERIQQYLQPEFSTSPH